MKSPTEGAAVAVAAAAALHPLEAEYCRARFMAASLKVTAGPSFTSIVADRKGNVLGLGAPPAREIKVGGDRCCSSASCGNRTTQHVVVLSYTQTLQLRSKSLLKCAPHGGEECIEYSR